MLYIILMHISCFMFFVNELLLALYMYFRLLMLDKKQIWVIFLFKFKIGYEAVETTHNISNAFGPC